MQTADHPPSHAPAMAQLRPPVWLLLALAAVLLGWRMTEPLGRDQAVFYVLGRESWHGLLPYRDLFEHKPPGILLLYAVVAQLDGGDGWGIGLVDTLAAGITALLLFDVVARWRDRRSAWLAAVLYLICCRAQCFGGWWATGQPEAFQDLCVATALWCGQRQRWLWVGVATWCALLLKFTYIGLVPVLLLWAGRTGALPLLLGIAAPTGALVAVGALTGVLGPAWDAVIQFNLRHAQVQAVPWDKLPHTLLRGANHLLLSIPAATLLGVLGLASARQPRKWLVWGLWLAAFGQLFLQRKFWLWHWNPLVLPLVLAVGMYVPKSFWRRPRLACAGVAILLIPTVFDAAKAVNRRFSEGSHADMLARYTWGRDDFSAAEVAFVGASVRQLAKPTDKLLVWGFEPGVYLASGLAPGTRWLYDYPLTVGLAPADRERAVSDMARQLPAIRWWVVFHNDSNALEHLDSRAELAQLPTLQQALDRDYRLALRVADADIFERIP